MKKLLLIILLLLFSSLVFSQEHNVLITTDKALLYKANDYISATSGNESRKLILLDNNKIKTLRRPCTLKILGIVNSSPSLYFDTYEVEYQNNIYYIPKRFVADNSYLDGVNKELEMNYSKLLRRVDSLKSEYDEKIHRYRVISQEKVSFYTHKVNELPQIIDSVKQALIDKYKADNDRLYEKQLEEWYNKLPKSTKNALRYIDVTYAKLASPNSAGGCDYTIYYINKSKKTIKYFDWDGWVYNAVNDIVWCDIRNTGHVSGRDTGPVASGESGGGTWDCVIYNYSAREVRVSSINITYLDNSNVAIDGNDVKRMLTKPEHQFASWVKIDSIRNSVSESFNQELTNGKDSLKLWQNRLNVLTKGKYAMIADDDPINDTIRVLLTDLDEAKEDCIDFENNNFLNSEYNSSVVNSISEIKRKSDYYRKRDRKVTLGLGVDGLISNNYLGTKIPLEVIIGRMNQLINFSLEGHYTYLKNIGYEGKAINQIGATASLYFNLGKSDYVRYPLSIGIGYNKNLGDRVFNVTGYYYGDDYVTTDFSFPLIMKEHNVSTLVSLGARWRHFKFAIYGRFDLDQLYDKSHRITNVAEHDLFYDDYSIASILDAPESVSLFGFSLKYYF